MKKILVFLTGMMLFIQHGYSQSQNKQTWTEDFDGSSVSFTATPSYSWTHSAAYYSPSTPGASYLGIVPRNVGDTTILETPVYDCRPYPFVFLRFSHICKVSPRDIVRVEYREGKGPVGWGPWTAIPKESYMGASTNYLSSLRFSAASYPEWQANDSTAIPTNLWWRDEVFDLENQVGMARAQFRFIIIHGSVAGTQTSYGWLLDNFEVMAADYQINPPTVQFLAPLVRDTVYGTGPWEINAKVKTNTSTPIVPPYLKWDTNGVFAGSVPMTMVSGDTLWRATIPQYILGTTVEYSITGIDGFNNKTLATSGYTIAMGSGKYVICGTGTTTSWYVPMNTYYQNSWSRQLYLANEFNPGASGGVITELAWDYAAGSPAFNYANQKCYFKAVDDVNALPDAYLDPVTAGATLVWQGTYVSPTGRAWVNMLLTQNFVLPPGKNLLVYWMHANGSYFSTTYLFNCTPMASMAVHRYCDAGGTAWNPQNCNNAATITYRPNARFFMIGGVDLDYSARMHSLDMPDTVPTSAMTRTPVVVTIKNKGKLNLDSATVSFSVNGKHQKDTVIKFSRSLPWDFNEQVTVGDYKPSMNGYDTIVVWVKLPNNHYDSTTWDDTLTKRIYGTTDLILTFVDFPQDTVYDVGPFNIAASIYSISGNTIVNNANLYVTIDNSLGINNYTLPMTLDATTSLWKTTIPQQLFGSDVVCKLMVTDYLGNPVNIAKSFYIKLLTSSGLDTSGYVVVGTDLNIVGNGAPCMFIGYNYSWSRQIYLSKEISPKSSEGGKITHLAWDYRYGLPVVKMNQKCYFKVVDDTVITNTGYLNPIADGATLVWQGNFATGTGRIWSSVQLITPFYLPPNKHLMIYWVDSAGAPLVSVSPEWYHTSTPVNRTVFAYGAGMPAGLTGTLTTSRCNARFYVVRTGISEQNSVSLQSIVSPGAGTTPNQQTPVTVTIQNEGFNNLTHCNIYWKLNGQLQPTTFAGSPTYTFANPLPSKFTETVTIGSFIPHPINKDTVVAWVELPNGVTDAITRDDTLRNISLACPFGILSGSYTIGSSPSADFSNFDYPIFLLRNCGISGKVTFYVEDGTYYESVNLSNIPSTVNDTIEIIALNKGKAIIETTVLGITMGNVDNILIKDMNINIVGTGRGILLNSGSNIEINGCTVILDTTITAGTHNCINKPAGATSHNVRLLNNVFSGGITPLSLYGKNDVELDTAWVIDGNMILNSFNRNAYILYIRLRSVSHNTVISRATSPITAPLTTGELWCGFMIQMGSVDIMDGNRIRMQYPTELPIGIAFHTTNQGTAPSDNPNVSHRNALLINNEIILMKKGANITLTINGTSQRSYGALQLDYSGVDFYNNSVYTICDVECAWYALYASPYASTLPPSLMDVRNNNLISNLGRSIQVVDNITANPPYPITLGYNNYYTGGSVLGVFRGTTAADITVWKNIAINVPPPFKDTNSMSVLPTFIDPTNHLKMSSIGKLIATRVPIVRTDIDNTPRGNTLVTIGCYEMLPVVSLNASLLDIQGLRAGNIGGQTDTVKVNVLNSGFTTITSLDLSWSLNGVIQGSSTHNVFLNAGDAATLPLLPPLTYPPVGNVDVKVWVNNVNGLVDGYQGDDTVSKTVTTCTGYSGVLVIGPSAKSDFKTIQEANSALDKCGIAGDITFAYEAGTYAISLDFTNNAARFGNYKLTVTSVDNNADSVIFKPTGTYGMTLGNTRNFTLKAITINRRGAASYGIYINNGCTNLVIRDCKILCDTTQSSYGVIHKTSTGMCDSIIIVNNVLEGEYYGIYWYDAGSSSTAYGTRYYIDSNIVRGQYYYGMYFYYVDIKSLSYNTVLSRTTSTTTTWYGIAMPAYCNVYKMVGNRIIQRSTAISSTVYGFYPYQYINYYLNNGVRAYIANNEISLYSTSTAYGIYAYYYLNANIYHNSIYIGGTGGSHYGINTQYYATLDVKNNNIVMTSSSGYPLYSYSSNSFISDYNNLYAPTYIGYYNGTTRTVANGMPTWHSLVPGEGHSVRVLPTFVDAGVNLKSNLELANSTNIDSLGCPPLVGTDINGRMRTPNRTMMGSYERQPIGLDLMLLRVQPTVNRVINKQHLTISVDVMNYGAVPISNATLRWSKNGTLQSSIPVTFNPLLSNQQQNVLIDTFTVNGNIGDKINIVAWVETINGQLDTVKWNDTASATYVLAPLAEFIAPPVEKPTNLLSFDVNVRIFEGTGAPVVAPKLYVQSSLNTYYYSDSIPMKRTGGENWTATIPPQYYGCKVVYWLPVADTVGNSIILMDSTNIIFDLGKKDTVIIGTGTGTSSYNPLYYYYYSYTRNYYRSWEIDAQQRGGYITSIAFYNTATTVSNVANVSFYLKAVTDSGEVSMIYRDPIREGATLVWGQATATTNNVGWVTFQLHTPFYLPPNMNLLVYCDNKSGASNNQITWQTSTVAGLNTSMYAYGTTAPFPPANPSYSISGVRPNMRLVMQQKPIPYPVNNLSLTTLLSPINDNDALCEISSSPLRVFLSNTGGYDYDFTKDNITIECEIISPDTTLSAKVSQIVKTGKLLSGESTIFTLIPSLPLVSGNTYIKVWLSNPLDNIFYDDTLKYVYHSEKIGLPVEEYFASTTIPAEFVSKPVTNQYGTGVWQVYRPTLSDIIQPDSAGTGILRFMGVKGTSAVLSTRQLDLYGAINPRLEFWYYHDTTLNQLNNSILEVYVYADKNPRTVLSILKRDRTYGHGWHKYTVPLNNYTSYQCVYLEFAANNKADADIGQFIDRITITSDQDLAVSKIYVSPNPMADVCDVQNRNKDVYVVLRTTTNQGIDFSIPANNTNIRMEIWSGSTLVNTVNYPLTSGIIAGNSSDTFKLASGTNFAKGTHQIKAYLTASVDGKPSNDRDSVTFVINPAITLISGEISNSENCLLKDIIVDQQVIIKNTGNMDIPRIEVRMEVEGDPTNSPQTCYHTINKVLRSGASDTVYLSYIVPAMEYYYVDIYAHMLCDSALVNARNPNPPGIRECVIMDDIAIMELVKPQVNSDTVGKRIDIVVRVENYSGLKDYGSVVIHARIEDADGANLLPEITTIIPNINPSETLLYTFDKQYIVPDEKEYYIKVFLDSRDIYPINDTLKEKRIPVPSNDNILRIGFDKFVLEQNIPNPAKHNTVIEYSVPMSGEVIFNIHSVSGQLLYTQTLQSESGKHSIELNTSNFAAGIYFYSMEYKGQKFVKRMSIKK